MIAVVQNAFGVISKQLLLNILRVSVWVWTDEPVERCDCGVLALLQRAGPRGKVRAGAKPQSSPHIVSSCPASSTPTPSSASAVTALVKRFF